MKLPSGAFSCASSARMPCLTCATPPADEAESSRHTVPVLGRASPANKRSCVLLPHPLSPTTPTIWPSHTSHETFFNTRSSPKSMLTL